MKDKIKHIVELACIDLLKNDSSIFSNSIEETSEYDARKLHEVCINHHFANYLKHHFSYNLPELWDKANLFCDIEFNREGSNEKRLLDLGVVRPDIIIHNRKSGHQKENILIVECKKDPANSSALKDDIDKIQAFMTSPIYEYHFGLQVIYYYEKISCTLFYHENDLIEMQSFDVSQK